MKALALGLFLLATPVAAQTAMTFPNTGGGTTTYFYGQQGYLGNAQVVPQTGGSETIYFYTPNGYAGNAMMFPNTGGGSTTYFYPVPQAGDEWNDE